MISGSGDSLPEFHRQKRCGYWGMLLTDRPTAELHPLRRGARAQRTIGAGRLLDVQGDLLASGRGCLATRTVGTDTAKSLYGNGARLVEPLLTAGCGR
jgi:hypothetical protein